MLPTWHAKSWIALTKLLLTGETTFGPGKLFMVKNRKPPSSNKNKCIYTQLCLANYR